MGGHVLVLGGARSGKTGFAERLAMRSGDSPLDLATAQALDAEMVERVRMHQQQPPSRQLSAGHRGVLSPTPAVPLIPASSPAAMSARASGKWQATNCAGALASSTGTSERAIWQASSSVRAIASEANTSPSSW